MPRLDKSTSSIAGLFFLHLFNFSLPSIINH